MVPIAGTPNISSASTVAVAAAPPIYAALAPRVAASAPCARLAPNSITIEPVSPAARQILEAFVAISDWKLIVRSNIVSSI